MAPALLNAVATQIAARETNTKVAELNYLLRCLLADRGSVLAARDHVARDRLAPTRVVETLKAAVNVATLAELDGNQWIVSAFAEALRSASAFDRMLSDRAFMIVPLDTRIGTVLTGASAAVASEGGVKMTTKVSLASDVLTPRKVAAIIAVAKELTLSTAPSTASLLGRELTGAIGVATDTAFIAALIASGITSTATAGGTSANTLTDLGVLLAAVARGASSRLYFITTSTVAGKLAVRGDTAGQRVFVGMGPNGGTLLELPALVSDGMPAGTLMLLDASRVAANADRVVLDVSEQVTLMMDSAPDSPPTASSVMTSAWQHDLIAMKADRFIGFELLSTSGAAVITGL